LEEREEEEGTHLDEMAENLDQAALAIVLASSQYKESLLCRTEARKICEVEKAHGLRNSEDEVRQSLKVVVIKGEKWYEPRGWLAEVFENKPLINPWISGTQPSQMISWIMDYWK